MSRGVHAFWFPPLFLDARLLWALSLFKDWVYFGCLSLSFSFFSSVCIIQFATISMVGVVMDIFINQNASKLFIDFLLCVLLKSGTRGFFVLVRVIREPLLRKSEPKWLLGSRQWRYCDYESVCIVYCLPSDPRLSAGPTKGGLSNSSCFRCNFRA